MTLGIRKIASIGVVAFGVLAVPSVAMAGDRDDAVRGSRTGHWQPRGAGGTEPNIAAFRERVRAREAKGQDHELAKGPARGLGRQAQERRPIDRRRVELVRVGHAIPGPVAPRARVVAPARVATVGPAARTSPGYGAPRLSSAPPVASPPRFSGAPRVGAAPSAYGPPAMGYGGPRFGYGPRVIRVVRVYRGPRFVYGPGPFGFRRFGYGPRFGYGFRRFGFGPRFAYR